MTLQRFRHFIDGEFCDAAETFESIDPSTEQPWALMPAASADDVDRAVRAAVEMQQALAGLNARWRDQGRPELNIHVGLNTGRVAAGNIGSERYLQYATIGDATNVASRVCSAAGNGEICMNDTTFERWRERAWPTSVLPDTWVKGKSEPLRLHLLEWNAPAKT